MTTYSDTPQRRLRVIEIALLADDHELSQACDRLCTALGLPAPDTPALPHAISWYDAADLPRSVQGELLAEIDDSHDDGTDADPQEPGRRVVCS